MRAFNKKKVKYIELHKKTEETDIIKRKPLFRKRGWYELNWGFPFNTLTFWTEEELKEDYIIDGDKIYFKPEITVYYMGGSSTIQYNSDSEAEFMFDMLKRELNLKQL